MLEYSEGIIAQSSAAQSRSVFVTAGLMDSDESEEETKPPVTDFGRHLHQLLQQDKKPIEPKEKYTAFWLARGLPLASQFRQGTRGCNILSAGMLVLPCRSASAEHLEFNICMHSLRTTILRSSQKYCA